MLRQSSSGVRVYPPLHLDGRYRSITALPQPQPKSAAQIGVINSREARHRRSDALRKKSLCLRPSATGIARPLSQRHSFRNSPRGFPLRSLKSSIRTRNSSSVRFVAITALLPTSILSLVRADMRCARVAKDWRGTAFSIFRS